MTTDDCIFCKIATGAIPNETIQEHAEGTIVSFLDIHPKSPGHTLMIPKKHYRWFLDMPNDEYETLMHAAREHARALKDEYGAEYVQVGIAGDEVPHVHVHLIPRGKAA